METVTIRGQEIFAAGRWNNDFYSETDLDAMVDAFNEVGFNPAIKIGHADGQEQLKADEYRKIFGAPSLGQIERIYRRGSKLFADFINVPKRLAELINKKAYSRISAEIFWQYACNFTGKTFPRVLKAVSLLGAEIPAITSLKDIEALYTRPANGAVYTYARGQEYRIYTSMQRKDENVMNQSNFGKFTDTNNQPTMVLGGLTAASREFARIALEYAQENNVDYPTAVKELMRSSTRRYEQQGPVSAATELARVAKALQGAFKIDFVDAMLSAAKQHPAHVKRIADDWLIEQSKRLARGRPGFQSDNEVLGLQEAIKQNPAILQVRNTGVLTRDVLRTLFPQWF